MTQPGPAVAPLQSTRSHVIATFQDPESEGISLFGLDRTTGAVAWQTILGAAWPTPLEPSRDGEAMRTIGQTGADATLSSDLLAAGGFLTLPLPRPGELKIPAGRALTLEGDGAEATVIVPGPAPARSGSGNPAGLEAWRKLDLPATCARCPWPGAAPC